MLSFKRSFIAVSTVILTLWMAIAIAGTPVRLEKVVQSADLWSVPALIEVRLYESESSTDIIAEQIFYQGEWQSDTDLSARLPKSGTIRFSMTLDQVEALEAGQILWAETIMDGQVMGERSALAAIQPPKFTIEGEIETKGATGGIRFPDGSFQDSASPLITGDGASTALDMNNNRISNLPTPTNAGDAVSLSYLQSYVANAVAIIWVDGAGCDLGGTEGSTCTTTATCPAGTTVVSGGCDGFTSVAIGRSRRRSSSTWQCYFRRIQTIGPSNLLKAQVACR